MTFLERKHDVDRGVTVVVASILVVLLVAAAGALATRVAAQSTSTTTAEHVPPPSALESSRKLSDQVGLRGHGFVRNADGKFDTIDVRDAKSFTIVFGVNGSGDAAGGYADARGAIHGFIRRGATSASANSETRIETLDFPGARGTVAFRINDSGQIIGAYGTERNVAAFQLPNGFLFDNGVFTKIDVPGAVETRPLGISNTGQIVGEYIDQERRTRGFLLTDGVYTTIDAPDSASTQATDIDDGGRIVGTSVSNTTGAVRGFLRDARGTFTPIDAPAATPDPGRPDPPTTQMFGLNNSGQIVGISTDSEGTHSFLLDNGVFTTIDAPDAVGTTLALDINDDGQLVGAFDVDAHGALRDQRGNFTTIDHPDAVAETVLSGINRRGQIVGAILDATNTFRSFLYDKGRFVTLEIPGALGSGANKINDRGQIVGNYSTLTNHNHAFPARGYLWDRGEVTLIDFPGAVHTSPNDIDNRGQIVGTYLDATGVFRSFLRTPEGVFTTIDLPGARTTSVIASNERGQMAGRYVDSSGVLHGFLLDQGVVTNIDVPGAIATLPMGINDRGDIVGTYDDGRPKGFLWRKGRFTKIGAPGAFQQGLLPFDIDHRGRIVGVYQ